MLDERLNERESDALYQAAIDGGAILDSLGLSWWLSHGSLMGAWRYGAIIPGDDDLDVAVPLNSVSLIEREAAARGWGFVRLAPYLAKIWNPLVAMYRTRYPWSWPYVDLALYERVDDKVWIEFAYHTRREAFAAEDVWPLKRTGFGPIVCPVPHYPDGILNVIYPNWSLTLPVVRYLHRTERITMTQAGFRPQLGRYAI